MSVKLVFYYFCNFLLFFLPPSFFFVLLIFVMEFYFILCFSDFNKFDYNYFYGGYNLQFKQTETEAISQFSILKFPRKRQVPHILVKYFHEDQITKQILLKINSSIKCMAPSEEYILAMKRQTQKTSVYVKMGTA